MQRALARGVGPCLQEALSALLAATNAGPRGERRASLPWRGEGKDGGTVLYSKERDRHKRRRGRSSAARAVLVSVHLLPSQKNTLQGAYVTDGRITIESGPSRR